MSQLALSKTNLIGDTPSPQDQFLAKNRYNVELSNPEILLSEEETDLQTQRNSQSLKTLNISQCENISPTNNGLGFPITQESKSTEQSESDEELESLETLRSKLESLQKSCHKSFLQSFRSWIFVGPVSYKFFLVQQECNLNLVRTSDLMSEIFYQEILMNFGKFRVCRIVKPVKTTFDFGKSEIWKKTKIPLDVLPIMLNEYFSIELDLEKLEEHDIDESAQSDSKIYQVQLKTLPNIFQIKPLTPEKYFIEFLTNLIGKINYNNEEESIESICRLVSKFYSQSQQLENREVLQKILAWARINYIPTEKIFTENDTIRPVANLPQLYTVFERC